MFRFLALLIAFACVAMTVSAQGQSPSRLVANAKTLLTRDFKDPESARYRNIGLYKARTGRGGNIVCGEVNGKNSFGAYVGFRRFVVAEGVVIIDKPDDPWTKTFGPSLCHELVAVVE